MIPIIQKMHDTDIIAFATPIYYYPKIRNYHPIHD